MASQKYFSATEHDASELTLKAAVDRFEAHLRMLTPTEAKEVLDAATRALRPRERRQRRRSLSPVIDALAGDQSASPAEQVQMEIDLLTRSFARRRALLENTLTASQVARLLNTSRQTPHDRLASGTLIAVKDRGAWRFPIWQFDPEGEDGVVDGLPDVIRALDVSPLASISWLTRPNPMLDRATPIECLKRGRVEEVIRLARAVGLD
jgi:hypothetical protein